MSNVNNIDILIILLIINLIANCIVSSVNDQKFTSIILIINNIFYKTDGPDSLLANRLSLLPTYHNNYWYNNT